MGSIFAEEISPASAKYVRRAIEVAVKLPRIRRSRKQRDRCWPLVGHLIILCAKSQKIVRISRETGSSREASLGSSLPFLKAFDAVFPPSADRPWVSEDHFTKEIIIITHENIFLIVNVVLFVNFPNVTVVHMGFHNKERQPERENNFSCQRKRRRLIPTKMFVWVAERTLKNIIGRQSIVCDLFTI